MTLTHCGREDLWKWAIFNNILTSPKSWLAQEDLDADCEHSLVPMDSWGFQHLTFNADYEMLKVKSKKNLTLLSKKKWKKAGIRPRLQKKNRALEHCWLSPGPESSTWSTTRLKLNIQKWNPESVTTKTTSTWYCMDSSNFDEFLAEVVVVQIGSSTNQTVSYIIYQLCHRLLSFQQLFIRAITLFRRFLHSSIFLDIYPQNSRGRSYWNLFKPMGFASDFFIIKIIERNLFAIEMAYNI